MVLLHEILILLYLVEHYHIYGKHGLMVRTIMLHIKMEILQLHSRFLQVVRLIFLITELDNICNIIKQPMVTVLNFGEKYQKSWYLIPH